jgi:hypothetical protein
MLFADRKDLHEGFDGAKKWAIEEEKKLKGKVRHRRQHPVRAGQHRQGGGNHNQQHGQPHDDIPPPSMPPAMP